MPLPLIRPQPLVRIPEPFNDPAWIWELKLDGFRALAYIENRECRLVSRNGYVYNTFDPLRASLLRELKVKDAILDGELVCHAAQGRSLGGLGQCLQAQERKVLQRFLIGACRPFRNLRVLPRRPRQFDGGGESVGVPIHYSTLTVHADEMRKRDKRSFVHMILCGIVCRTFNRLSPGGPTSLDAGTGGE